MLSGGELIDTENISLPIQNMKFGSEWAKRTSLFMFDLRMINMSSECEYDWYCNISACSTEFEICDSFASLTRYQTSYSGSAGWYFRYQSIHLQITYTFGYSVRCYLFVLCCSRNVYVFCCYHCSW
jgi:hypothetical protein